MTIPEYDEECDCEMCKQLRNERNPQLSPYRCETCDHVKFTITEYEDCTDTRIFCNKINREIFMLSCEHPHEFLFTGCASHSSVPNVKKILNELEEWLIENSTKGPIQFPPPVKRTIEKIGELRGKP
jgi:hypothetical protein